MNRLDDWFSDLVSGRSAALTASARGVGTVSGGTAGWSFARIEILAEPDTSFSIRTALTPDLEHEMEERGFLRAATLGILDVFIGRTTPPLRDVRVTILRAELDPI